MNKPMQAEHVPRNFEPINYFTRVKAAIKRSGELSINVIQHEFSDDGTQEYRKVYSFADCNVRLAYEDGTIIDAEDFDKVFEKPMVVIYCQSDDNDILTNGNLVVEFNILVNTKDAGRIKLDAYTQLCQLLLNPEEFGGYWTQFGLFPRGCKTTEIKDGKVIDPDLAGRLLLRSILVRFSVLGELYGAR